MPGAKASVTFSSFWSVQLRTVSSRSGLTVAGRPLTRLYDVITPVAASAAIAGRKAASSYSFSTRGRRSDDVVARSTSLL